MTSGAPTPPNPGAAPVLLLVLGLVSWSPTLAANTPTPCGTEQAHAFDFWIGDWSIEQKIRAESGEWLTLPARTSVSPALHGCALVERWEGQVQFFWEGMKEPEPMAGLSVRAYDESSDSWRIHWMDSRSPRFGPPFEGRFRDGRGEFEKVVDTPAGERRTRIVFSEVTEDSVHWELSVSNDGGGSWSPLWIMEMRRSR